MLVPVEPNWYHQAVPFTLRLPDDLINAIDQVRGNTSRTKWIQYALEAQVRNDLVAKQVTASADASRYIPPRGKGIPGPLWRHQPSTRATSTRPAREK
jgi:hypothetical protein